MMMFILLTVEMFIIALLGVFSLPAPLFVTAFISFSVAFLLINMIILGEL